MELIGKAAGWGGARSLRPPPLTTLSPFPGHILCRVLCPPCRWAEERGALEAMADDAERGASLARAAAAAARTAAHEAREQALAAEASKLSAEDEHLSARVALKQLQARMGETVRALPC